MDNFESNNFNDQDFNDPIPLDDSSDVGETGISHAPLDLGGSKAVEISKTNVPKQAAPKQEVTKQAVAKSAENVISTERIEGVRTFFTKLHPGAINFLDEQITEWLKKNPDIHIKRTNVTIGQIQAKKTEPNILITVWY